MYASDALSGRRALVTGGSKGIGAAIVRQFAAAGADVVLTAQDMVTAQALADEVGAAALKLSLNDPQIVLDTLADQGEFDILVNCAGQDQHAFFTKTEIADWRYLLAVNLEAVLATTQAVLPGMQAKRFGRIINIGSEAGSQGSKGGSVYAAAKGGVIAFTKSIARENARYGITANVIAPGPVDTPLLRKAVDRGGEALLKAMESATLLGRLGQPDEVAAAVAYLASDQGGFVTGENWGISGGMGC